MERLVSRRLLLGAFTTGLIAIALAYNDLVDTSIINNALAQERK